MFFQTSFLQHRWTPSPVGPLHALSFGTHAPSIVVVHGVTGCSWAWHALAAELPDHGILAVDLRGHGDSAWSPDHRYSTADHVDDLALHTDSIGRPFDLVGSSWGALVAMEFAARFPDSVRRLVLLDIEPSFTAKADDVMPRPRSFANVDEAATWIQSMQPAAPAGAVAAMVHGSLRAAADGTLVPKHDPYFFEHWPFRDGDHWSTVDAVTCPTLLVHASRTWVKGEVMAQMAQRMRSAELVEIDSSHVIPVDAPATLAPLLRTFLA
jgi:pimeloyl-ACP methyl ester carboxylesterase